MAPLLKDGSTIRGIRRCDLQDNDGHPLLEPAEPAQPSPQRAPACEPAPILEVTKTLKGQQLIFTFTFEATEEEREEDPPPQPEPKEGFTFLCAEDNRVNQILLRRIFSKYGQEHEIVENGLQAVETYEADPERYRCILMDLAMPIMGGLEATSRIRAWESTYPRLRRAFVIGLAPRQIHVLHALRYADAGLDALMEKPLRPHVVAQVLFGGPDTNVLLQDGGGARLTEAERRPYPLRAREEPLLGRSPRERAVREELWGRAERGELDRCFPVDVLVRVLKSDGGR